MNISNSLFEKLGLHKAIAFGASDLQPGLDSYNSKKVLFKALDVGVEYFDTAPRYLLSEKFLGEHLQNKEIKIATKVGLDPLGNFSSLVKSQLKRRLKKPFKYFKKKNISNYLCEDVVPSTIYDKKSFARSIESSLRNLRRDYLDVLFLHEPENFINLDELTEMLKSYKSKGYVGEIGFACHRFTEKLNSASDDDIFWQIPYSARHKFSSAKIGRRILYGTGGELYRDNQVVANYEKIRSEIFGDLLILKSNKASNLNWISRVR